MTLSVIEAGLDATNGRLPQLQIPFSSGGVESLISGSSIGPISIAGTLSDDSFLFSPSLPKKATIDGKSIETSGDARFALPG